jgi:siroheme synthase
MSKGRVFLIGAGPGDPELITVKGLKCLEKADVVVYDYLANEQLLGYIREGAEKVYVRKGATTPSRRRKSMI